MANLICCDCCYSGFMAVDPITKRLICKKCGSKNLASDE